MNVAACRVLPGAGNTRGRRIPSDASGPASLSGRALSDLDAAKGGTPHADGRKG